MCVCVGLEGGRVEEREGLLVCWFEGGLCVCVGLEGGREGGRKGGLCVCVGLREGCVCVLVWREGGWKKGRVV